MIFFIFIFFFPPQLMAIEALIRTSRPWLLQSVMWWGNGIYHKYITADRADKQTRATGSVTRGTPDFIVTRPNRTSFHHKVTSYSPISAAYNRFNLASCSV
ncbi:hypothetical protein M431DRAFT_435308 [Trichoderma harzianum CBS 226.95]|uniref:Secreted protein n=1 Tax=Trichoderma harzianum CBS 226.95 TaxID=983964 RepID=A0A2T4AD40_TRIHA|nr:hypothetical protein M431DRAFT_435308 [Trichoderma harzianum CBS 226.95]PTB55000.1 hypothetical protein M431DRAFT_435308 [Trichoderma harzianum CBS 226.95]